MLCKTTAPFDKIPPASEESTANVPPRKSGSQRRNGTIKDKNPVLTEVFIDSWDFFGCSGIVKWRRERDSNPRYPLR
jgi:hypothetical protein